MSRSWVRLELAVADFDPTPFRRRAAETLGGDISLTTMAELENVAPGRTEEHQRRLWELNLTCSEDIPDRGDFFNFEEYRAIRLGKASARPDGQVVAIERLASAEPSSDPGSDPGADTCAGRWVGLCLVAHNPGSEWAFVDMTGVLRSHRRRGLSLAMKLPAIEQVRAWGVGSLRTFHHPDNAAAIAANRALGFRDSDFEMPVPIPDPD